MKLRTPSHATVVAYLALFVAIGGSAYAVSKIGSAQIENRSIKGKDVADAALGGRQIQERKLTGPLAVGDARSTTCDPPLNTEIDCIGKSIKLPAQASILLFGTARGEAGTGTGECALKVDGASASGQLITAEARTVTLTRVTGALPRGQHTVALACRETTGDLIVSSLAISAVAVTNADLG